MSSFFQLIYLVKFVNIFYEIFCYLFIDSKWTCKLINFEFKHKADKNELMSVYKCWGCLDFDFQFYYYYIEDSWKWPETKSIFTLMMRKCQIFVPKKIILGKSKNNIWLVRLHRARSFVIVGFRYRRDSKCHDRNNQQRWNPSFCLWRRRWSRVAACYFPSCCCSCVTILAFHLRLQRQRPPVLLHFLRLLPLLLATTIPSCHRRSPLKMWHPTSCRVGI